MTVFGGFVTRSAFGDSHSARLSYVFWQVGLLLTDEIRVCTEDDEVLPEEKRRTEGRFGSTSAREIDQRNQKPPIPDKLKDYLTDEQIGAIRRLEPFGWSMENVAVHDKEAGARVKTPFLAPDRTCRMVVVIC